MTHNQGNGNGFTTKEILVEFREEMRREFKKMGESFATAHDDHETRIRATESSVSRVKGALAVIGLALPAVAALAAALIH